MVINRSIEGGLSLVGGGKAAAGMRLDVLYLEAGFGDIQADTDFAMTKQLLRFRRNGKLRKYLYEDALRNSKWFQIASELAIS